MATGSVLAVMVDVNYPDTPAKIIVVNHGHFNPNGKLHGSDDQAEHHAGDLPSLTADGLGVAHLNFETSAISVGGGIADVVGRGLIVHRDPDDFKTQPTGNSGPRLACGAIVKN